MPAHILNMGGHCPPIMATLTPMSAEIEKLRSALVNGPISRQNYQLCYFYCSFNHGCIIICVIKYNNQPNCLKTFG